MSLSFTRKRERESCSRSKIRTCPHTAAVGLYDRSRYGQPHTGALRLCSVKRVKNPLGAFRQKANSSITDRNEQPAVFICSCPNRQFAASILHSFDCI